MDSMPRYVIKIKQKRQKLMMIDIHLFFAKNYLCLCRREISGQMHRKLLMVVLSGERGGP